MADPSYSFSTKPGSINLKRAPLFRPEEDADPVMNVMFDRRVVRGNTYSGQVVAGATVATSPQQPLSPQRRRGRGTKGVARGRSIYEGRPKPRHEAVDLTQFLEEQREEVAVAVEETQTSFFLPRAQTPPYVPRKTGTDRGTQIEGSDGLFDFDREVDPILDVIVGKTLEQSLLEVSQEEELLHLRGMRSGLEASRVAEEERIREMERAEIARWKAKEEVKRREAERLRNEYALCEKVAARNFFRSWLGDLQARTFAHLAEVGHFRDAQRDAVVQEFLPALFEDVARKVDAVQLSRTCVDSMLRRALELRSEAHAARTAAEEAAVAAAEEEERRSATIRIFVRGVNDGEGGEGIQVLASDTVSEVEAKISAWMAENAGDFGVPAGGFLRTAFAGAELDDDDKLLDTALAKSNVVEINLPEGGDGEEGGEDAAAAEEGAE